LNAAIPDNVKCEDPSHAQGPRSTPLTVAGPSPRIVAPERATDPQAGAPACGAVPYPRSAAGLLQSRTSRRQLPGPRAWLREVPPVWQETVHRTVRAGRSIELNGSSVRMGRREPSAT